MSEQALNPWYREPWPWFIIAILALGVTFGISILAIGIANPPHMVRGEYERLGRGLTDVGHRTELARELGLQGQLTRAGTDWQLSLAANERADLPAQLLLIVQHPVNAELDRTTLMQRNDQGQWIGQWAEPAPHSTLIVQDLEQRWWISARLPDEAGDSIALLPRRL